MSTPNELVEVVVGVIGRAHGIRGDVSIDVRTDEPDRRFQVGAELRIENTNKHFTPSKVTWHSGRLIVHFEELADRNAAEAARGSVLVVDVDPEELPDDEEEFYDRQLVGLMAQLADGTKVGPVTSVVHLPSQDLLAIDVDGTERLVPFVSELVPEVDLAAGTLTVVAMPGLLEDEDEDQ